MKTPLRHVTAIVSALILMLCVHASNGSSATWKRNARSSDWNTKTNWTPATVPDGSADTATFALSNTTNVSISANTQVNGITFTPAASAYNITVNPNLTLTISGVGIVNNSGTTQNFVTAVNFAANVGLILFKNAATAGSDTSFTNNGSAVFGMFGGQTQFFNTTTASNGTFTNNGGTASNALGGHTVFNDSSTAANGTFINNGTAASFAAGGQTIFYDTSNAANGTFINNGAGFGPGGFDGIGHTDFLGSSSAGSATITNNGGTVTGAGGGQTDLAYSSTAANGTFINNGAGISGAGGGFTTVISTAANGIFINNGGTANGAEGGFTEFFGAAAANATVTNNGATVSGAGGGFTEFFGANVGSGTFTFTNNGATVSGAGGGFTKFFGAAAPNATVTNNGATVSGAEGGFTELFSANVGSATLIANGGTGGGGGGAILFLKDSTVGTARVEVFGNGSLDISLHNAPGMTIDSVEGDGNVFLGANNLTVGSNNKDTTFSCRIEDGGQSGSLGGSLTKIGMGTLDLTGANTYTGNTKILGGALKVNGSITSNTRVGHSGTLAGTGTINGNVTNNGTVSPGDALGTLTINGNYTNNGGLLIDIAGANSGQFSLLDVLGSADLHGFLDPVLLDGFTPTIGQSFTFLDYASVTGAFSDIDDRFSMTVRNVG